MTESRPDFHEASRRLAAVETQIRRGIVGQDELVRGLLIGLLADGHLLIEGVPGLGKTRAVNLLAKSCQVGFKRLQFTPDLLPADILGTRIYNQQVATFETVRGPIFTNFVLADEINRAPAKVQSALLETMQERQVTIGKETLPVSPPFIVFATQNPIEQEGTYPLPEAQLDRFLMKLVVTHPSKSEEERIVRMVVDELAPPSLDRVLDADGVIGLQAVCREVRVDDRLISYATALVHSTRPPSVAELELGRYVELGASPRGTISLVHAARASALLDDRRSVLPDDIKAVAPAVLRHRILPTYVASAERISVESIVAEVVASVRVP